ncbi:MAG: hypothetical protein K9G42_01530 [Pedobacter sp.]|nr:hypothetical protein [Pedobacter sp.]
MNRFLCSLIKGFIGLTFCLLTFNSLSQQKTDSLKTHTLKEIKIELVRGTGSLQYGGQFGGMLNYVSKDPDSARVFTFESMNLFSYSWRPAIKKIAKFHN